ncbi:MAG: hypothetical protein H6Q41_5785 [Deltaproteobacteria bacterium]|nr:hypothetical protein [Deltaproteobacteria bacterium]
MKKTIVLLGRLDSKGKEYAYVKDLILRGGFGVIVIDVGTRGAPQFEPDISREEVARAAGVKIEDVVDPADGDPSHDGRSAKDCSEAPRFR